ncbi:MAG: class I SAM-dependent methyltransferase [Candidatus Hydrogenedentes bacterium]|nr:class I SAM-dependent methyltransferase [Candidatus Hydrogenedentota bacterium]
MDDNHDAYRRFHRRRHRALLDVLAAHVPAKVARFLDIGSGGDVAGARDAIRERFADELHTVDLGVDVAAGAAKGWIASTCDIDAEPLPYPAAHFDVVLFASVIEHLYNPRPALAEIARVLRPGGVLVLEAPNAVALGRRLDALAGRNPFHSFNRYNAVQGKARMAECSVFYTVEEIAEALDPWFSVLESRFTMHSPPVNPLKGWIREAAFRLVPRLGDCLIVAARRTDTRVDTDAVPG